jgi:hypothetical protein
MKKTEYLDLMEQVVTAYSIEQIEDYIQRVRQRGVWEHGFPRLGANIGILIAHGRLLHLKGHFLEIMELCCRDIPVSAPECEHRGNDFSVKEICWCLLELEKTMGIMPGTTICGLADGTAWATRTFVNKFYDEFASKLSEPTVPLTITRGRQNVTTPMGSNTR